MEFLSKIQEISEFQYGEKAEVGNVEPMETHEHVKAIFENMQSTADYLNTGFVELGNYHLVIKNAVSKELESHHDQIKDLSERQQEEIAKNLEGHHAALKEHDERVYGKMKGMLHGIKKKLNMMEGAFLQSRLESPNGAVY
jgi:hypothetical protein